MKLFLSSASAFLFSMIVQANEINHVQSVLDTQTTGRDATYSRIVLPGQSLQSGDKLSKIIAVNNRIASEITTVIIAFNAAMPNELVSTVRSAASQIDGNLQSKTGHIVFEGKAPTAMQARTLLFIPKNKLKPGQDGKTVLDIFSSYRRSAKKDDTVFEYENAFQLTAGKIIERDGSDSSWLKPEAPAAFPLNEVIAMKKCRQLLGWRCTTSIYRAEQYAGSNFIFSFNYDMENNEDHSKFKSSQSKNQLDGTTGVTLVKESAEWIMMFVTDHRYKEDKQSFSSIVQSEFQEDMERLKTRLATDLGIAQKDIK